VSRLSVFVFYISRIMEKKRYKIPDIFAFSVLPYQEDKPSVDRCFIYIHL
jgi:hypothetical protein